MKFVEKIRNMTWVDFWMFLITDRCVYIESVKNVEPMNTISLSMPATDESLTEQSQTQLTTAMKFWLQTVTK